MKLFKLSQSVSEGWDTYDSCVVAAPNEETARSIHPDGRDISDSRWGDWAKKPADVVVELIGTAIRGTKQGVICASFNAG